MALTDRQLLRLRQKHDDLKAQEAEIKKQLTEVDTKILQEMERRGVKSITFSEDGSGLTYVQGTMVDLDENGWMHFLSSRPRLRSQVVTEKLDYGAIMRAHEAGKIKAATLARLSTIRPKSPYVNTSKPK